MDKTKMRVIRAILFSLLAIILIVGSGGGLVNAQDVGGLEGGASSPDYAALIDKFDSQDHMRVIVQLKVAETITNEQLMTTSIQAVQNDLLTKLNSRNFSLIHTYDYIPFMAVEVNRAGLDELVNSPLVIGIEEDILMKAMLAQSVPLINADDVWAAGYTGAGQVVAVLDTGVDKNHSALTGKVISEACYSTTSTTSNPPTTSLCPGGVSETTDSDSALPYISGECPTGECDHGTHVAGIVAGNNSTIKGVAKDANLIAVQVFSRLDDGSDTVGSWQSDQIKGLERVYALRTTYSIASVNLSLGGGSYSSSAVCDTYTSYKAAVDQLKSAGIATVAASGNDGFTSTISSPACISSVVSVGATTKTDEVASYSNSADILDLLAPGSSIYSSIPNNLYATWSGTSMATPHVAGAWALIKSAVSGASVNEVLNALKTTGVPILDTRNGITKPRIDVLAAFQQFILPAIPTNVTASNGTYTDKVTISWEAAENATYYMVYRNLIDSTTGATQLVADQSSSPYDDSSGEQGTLYYYWVKGCNDASCSDYSTSDAGWRSGLTAPTGISASDGTYPDKVQISWNGVGDADYYKVFRNTTDSTAGASTLDDNVSTTTFDDLTAVVGTDYFYWVQACKIAGNECSDYSASDVGYLNNDYHIFLPLLMKNAGTAVDPILNGDFEAGQDGSWTESSSNGWDLINPSEALLVPPHGGDWAVWLGGDYSETSLLSQEIAISSSIPYLHFWYWIGSEDYCGYFYDAFRLKIDDTQILEIDLCSETDTGAWVEKVVNLSSYAESSIILMFEVTTDSSINSNFFLDDVSMSNVATASSAVVGDTQLLGDTTARKTVTK